ncbi:inorganic phosphate transporter [Aquisphaera insulae]|uniref:inorganic phosphate transporter n=1 Tax=Aquisphaera insulae TaxID=2712864 RepID=UPI0013ED9F69|nr:inorganic phosphate transporter [Aquisphaera insulae]
MVEFLDAVRHLDPHITVILAVALLIAFGFEVVNGFHDTANAVTTVIYTRTLRPIPAVFFSGFCNFLGVLLGGTAIAFSIVHLLPVELLIEANSRAAIAMVLSLLVAGLAWNLSTWYVGLPVSSSHTLIGSILGVGMAHSLLSGHGPFGGVNWTKAGEVGLSLFISPLIGFASAAILLRIARRTVPDPELYEPPPADPEARPPWWIRGVLVGTCGGVSLAHGSNDGQKGMGLIMLVLMGLLPASFALNLRHDAGAQETRQAAERLKVMLMAAHPEDRYQAIRDLDSLIRDLDGKISLREVPVEQRWRIHSTIFRLDRQLDGVTAATANSPADPRETINGPRKELRGAIEYVPTWVIVGVALCLGIGTTVGYKRIVVTVAEKIGKSHLTYAQGASAEVVAMATIGMADLGGLPVSTTQVLSSGVAGTMWANRSGVQGATVRNILLAWLLTLPASMLLAAGLYLFSHAVIGH